MIRDARPNTGHRAKAVALDINYACAITRADRIHHLRHTNNAMAGLACATLNVGISVAIKTVPRSILVELDFVTALAILYCANANILAKFVLMFWNKLWNRISFLFHISTWMVIISRLLLFKSYYTHLHVHGLYRVMLEKLNKYKI